MRDCYFGMQIKMQKSKERTENLSNANPSIVRLFQNRCFFLKNLLIGTDQISKTIDKINGLIIENLRLFDIHYMSTIWNHKQL